MMRSNGSMDLETWVKANGGVRGGAAKLGKAASTVSRWITGQRTPDEDRPLLERVAGVKAPRWDTMAEAPAAPAAPVQAVAPPRAPRRAATVKPTPAPIVVPAIAEAALPVVVPPPPVAAPPRPAKGPASVAEMQIRLRQIPEELRQLRDDVRSGEVVMTSAEPLRRLLEGEAKALSAGITAQGTATVEEVEALRALVRDVTSGCEGCRARVTAALREMGR